MPSEDPGLQFIKWLKRAADFREEQLATNNFSYKANFDSVIFDHEALAFHAKKYEDGAAYKLARQCWQYLEIKRNKDRTDALALLEEIENRENPSA